jgi:hypothetical protein
MLILSLIRIYECALSPAVESLWVTGCGGGGEEQTASRALCICRAGPSPISLHSDISFVKDRRTVDLLLHINCLQREASSYFVTKYPLFWDL